MKTSDTPYGALRAGPLRSLARARICLALAAAFGTASIVSTCRNVALTLDPAPETAAIRADGLLQTLGALTGPKAKDSCTDGLRLRLMRAMLVPSHLYDNPPEWMRVEGETRTASFLGSQTTAGYRFVISPKAPPPRTPPQSAGDVRLRRIAASEYEWVLRDVRAVGGPSIGGIRAGFAALLASARVTAREGIAPLSSSFPQTTRSLGGILVMEALSADSLPNGATIVSVVIRIRPEAIRANFPAYARYLRRRIAPMECRLRVVDETASSWCEMKFDRMRLALRFAVAEGFLAPLDGGPLRPLPAKLRLRGGFLTRSNLLTVGLERLDGDIFWMRNDRRFSMTVRFPRQPDWRLPFLVEPLIASSLRRPFEKAGACASLSAEDNPSGGTIWTSKQELAVKESWIIRWLGGIVGGTAGDFIGEVERESARLKGDVIEALRRDLHGKR